MPYKGQIIHFKGGVFDWMGELKQGEHPNGKNWYRILNPCIVSLFTDKDGKMGIRLRAIQGDGNLYKKYIDIRVPDDSIIEVWPVDNEGDLYSKYKKESARKKSNIIIPANAGGISLQ